MARTHPIANWAAIIAAFGSSVAFAQEFAFFSAWDFFSETMSRLESTGDGKPFDNLSPDVQRARAVRALASRLLATAEFRDRTASGQGGP